MTRLYKLDGDALVPVAQGRLAKEEMIESWVAQQPELLGVDILIIGRQFSTEFGGRIDLLGIDVDGNLVIVELKRDRHTARDHCARARLRQLGCRPDDAANPRGCFRSPWTAAGECLSRQV